MDTEANPTTPDGQLAFAASNAEARPARRPRTQTRRPRSRAEYRAAAEIANLFLLVSLGRIYGLLDLEGRIDTDACEKLLAEARTLGISPNGCGPAAIPFFG
jgi:hypothetical protein